MRISVVVFSLFIMASVAWAGDVVSNGSFEQPPVSTERPRYWYVGWADSTPAYAAQGEWALDATQKTEGLVSVKLSPQLAGGYQFSQIVHVPTYNLSGKTVTVTADIRKSGLSEDPWILVFALNPTLPDDPQFGIGMAGKVILTADGPQEQWQTYSDSFTATDNAVCIAVALITDGTTGSAWFDNVQVELDEPVPGPEPSERASVLENREFRIGFVGDNPIDLSEKAEEEMISKIASRAEVFNVFFHVRWTHLTGEDISVGHKQRIEQAQRARAAGLQLIMTFDFTHDAADSVGELNPAPDGNPPPGATPFDLTNPVVRNAYKQEILGLANIVHPRWVMVGIEMDIFHGKYPEQWDEYVTMYKEIYDELKLQDPFVKVGAYFCLSWMVSGDCTVSTANAADWQMLLPELDFTGYSAYPGTDFYPATGLDSGYFNAAVSVAPGLPLLLSEFGVVGGASATLTEAEQVAFLERIFQELSEVDVEVACWYSMYDQSYIGAPAWFQEAFGQLGMHRQDGTSKEVWAAMDAAYKTPNPFLIIPKKKSKGCNLAEKTRSFPEIIGMLLPVLLLGVFVLTRRKSRTRFAA